MANDMLIIGSIVSILLFIGVLLPFVTEPYGQDAVDYDVDELSDKIGQEVDNVNHVSSFRVVLSVLSIFFWVVPGVPFWLNAFFVLLRIILAITIARNVWIGGGG